MDMIDLILGQKRDFHRCTKDGEWKKPENITLSCEPNGKFIVNESSEIAPLAKTSLILARLKANPL